MKTGLESRRALPRGAIDVINLSAAVEPSAEVTLTHALYYKHIIIYLKSTRVATAY